MAKYQQYAEYKDTQDSWLSLIPNKWEVVPLKFLCLNPVKDGPHETPVFIDDGIPFLSVDGIQNNQLVFNGCRYISEKDHEKYSKKCAPVHGDILLGKAASVGKVAYVDTSIEFNVWSPLAVITPKDARLGKYIFYAFQSTMLQAQCEVYSNSNTQKNLGMNTIDNLHLPCPSYKEAEKIANFLDYETAQIDTLIEKQQTLIQLLKEKRQAVISHAVTKGLNPDAPMKDSGVEWLGEVPEHWEVLKLGNYAIPLNGDRGANYPSGNDFVDEGVLFISATQVIDGRVETSNASKITLKKYNQLGGLKIKKGDILYCLRGAGVGKSGICTFAEGSISSSLMGVRATSIDPYYLMLLLNSSVELQQRSVLVTGSVSPNLSAQNVMDYKFAIPKDSEQLEIISHVKNSLKKIDILLNKAEQAIQLMQERRTALISAAVTGKIDVRGWTAPDIEVGT
ncbi:restriction endonuclease subunit S [Psychrobacter sp. A3]|uniref:restriction endonuclease subunit S n=1 Tax=Psychrobacter sp. A3 TaxID=2992754 RepID=UPI00237C175C|nr:restriction endonuclease subunit S [Psychrobacter sp. A3]MDE0490132.1 restriction endonuclease subunit S [Psychrobacter sp. A3]